jgi:hypothetical protein
MKRAVLSILLALVAAVLISGCAAVEPWEREHLAGPMMLFDDAKEQRSVREHFLGTREGSTGSFGVSGGGCGCN